MKRYILFLFLFSSFTVQGIEPLDATVKPWPSSVPTKGATSSSVPATPEMLSKAEDKEVESAPAISTSYSVSSPISSSLGSPATPITSIAPIKTPSVSPSTPPIVLPQIATGIGVGTPSVTSITPIMPAINPVPGVVPVSPVSAPVPSISASASSDAYHPPVAVYCTDGAQMGLLAIKKNALSATIPTKAKGIPVLENTVKTPVPQGQLALANLKNLCSAKGGVNIERLKKDLEKQKYDTSILSKIK
ncbi:hypothetical protein [Holospora curviuscula]|uniref:Uncharacterized protein n=1 Tax=Holospora curviuscula TaxID=1082868 RepID=A0A2S5R7Q2_9PROT|nr:hypothetical protein [Holospora curviuscula]PPE03366.1 hypothetical protein HCUR_01198 [Holospora curviuscula]